MTDHMDMHVDATVSPEAERPSVEEMLLESARSAEESSVTPETPAAPTPQEDAPVTQGPPNPYLDEARQLYLGFALLFPEKLS